MRGSFISYFVNSSIFLLIGGIPVNAKNMPALPAETSGK